MTAAGRESVVADCAVLGPAWTGNGKSSDTECCYVCLGNMHENRQMNARRVRRNCKQSITRYVDAWL